mmetsp:Transcript_921/g.1162  ORF Transcript_921/g.1162 Transcript_921/m.1162 type:complete len:178 (-) Transcript_921:551-1084(-)
MGSFATTHKRSLIYRRPKNMEDPINVTFSDSSHANAPGLGSYYGVGQRMCEAFSSRNAFSGWQVHPSTRDAELIAAIKGFHRLLAERMLLIEAGLPHQMLLCIDSSATVAGTKTDQIHHDSRYAAIRIGVLRQAVREALCTCVYTRSNEMLADVLTKALTPLSMNNHYDSIYGQRNP